MANTDARLRLMTNVSVLTFNLLQDALDARVNFVCLDYPAYIEQIEIFSAQTTDELRDNLDSFIAEVLDCTVNIDMVQGGITLPALMQVYK